MLDLFSSFVNLGLDGVSDPPVGNAQLEHVVRQLKTRVEGLVYYPSRELEHIFSPAR